jgi:acetyl esterase/lipase
MTIKTLALHTHAFDRVGIWDCKANMARWNAYLGNRRGTDNFSIYATPARATDFSGFPSTHIDTWSTRTLRDVYVAYAQNLWRDGTQCELHVWPGAYHGFEGLNPSSQQSIMARKMRIDWLRRLLFDCPGFMRYSWRFSNRSEDIYFVL